MSKVSVLLAAAISVVAMRPAAAAEPVMVQCGREYQAARSAGTLNGADWNAYRTACAERLKAAPTSAASAAPASATPVATSAALPAASAAATPGPTAAPSPGMAAMHVRQKQCGAEWTANKVTLVAATPGLTWPKYWSQCNTRIKAAGH